MDKYSVVVRGIDEHNNVVNKLNINGFIVYRGLPYYYKPDGLHYINIDEQNKIFNFSECQINFFTFKYDKYFKYLRSKKIKSFICQ